MVRVRLECIVDVDLGEMPDGWAERSSGDVSLAVAQVLLGDPPKGFVYQERTAQLVGIFPQRAEEQ